MRATEEGPAQVSTRLLALTAVALLCAALVSCSSGSGESLDDVLEPAVLPHEVWGRPDRHYSGSGPTVAVLGDDTIRASAIGLRRSLAGYSLKVAGISGEGFTGGERSGIDPPSGMQRIAREYAEDLPDRVVISLGFHDLRPDKPGHQVVMNSAHVLFDQFGQSCIVGVTNVSHPPLPDHRKVRAAALNAVVEERSDRIVDWNAMVRENPGHLSSDGYTPSADGAEALIEAIRLHVEACV